MAPAQTIDGLLNGETTNQKSNIKEDYEGGYRFAPITEAEVSRAMIKRSVDKMMSCAGTYLMVRFTRYFNTMYERAVSDVVIIGAGSAGLSCAWHLANTRPEVCCGPLKIGRGI